MFAKSCIFGAFLLLFLTENISAEIIPTCDESKLENMYPLDDPNLFYYCRDKFTPQILSCPSETGFQYNEEAVGCVPWSEWNCTYQGPAHTCENGTQDTYKRHLDPNLYYGCKNNTPVLIPCPEGSGFTYTTDMFGCLPWDMWECSKQIV